MSGFGPIVGYLKLCRAVPTSGTVTAWRCWFCGTAMVVARGVRPPKFCKEHA